MKNSRFLVFILAIVGVYSVAPAQQFMDDFESYAAGSQMHGQGGWKGWDNVAGAGAPASSAYAYSGSNSVEIIGSADLVHEFDISGGRWVLSTMQYIPSGTTGSTYFILLNTYNDGANAAKDWSVQWNMNMATGTINLELGSGTANIVYDQWVELKCIINLDENTVDEYYNGELISTHQWDDNVNGTLQCIDLYGNSASSVYYDDVKVEQFFIYKAYEPDPADGSIGAVTPLLKWTAGDTAAFHDVYFGTNPTPGPDEFIRQQPLNQNLYYHVAGLAPGTTYYWRIDEVEADGTTIHTGDVWSFTAAPLTAYDPDPADGAKWVDTEADLSWASGATAIFHDVYFGTNQTDVADGTGDTFKGKQPMTNYDPGTLAAGTTYYWRVDEYDQDDTKYPGEVWSFTTLSAMAGVRGQYYHHSGSTPPSPPESAFGTLVLTRVDPGINFNWGSGSPDASINADDFSVRWVANLEVPISDTYTFWTYTDDGVMLWFDGRLIIDNWTDHANTWNSSRPVALTAGQTHSIEMWWYERGGGARAELHWSTPTISRQPIPAGPLLLPLKASRPNPANGAVDVKHTPKLRWSAGEEAAQHAVYLGTDPDAVANATTASAGIYRGQQNLDETSYVPTGSPLDWGTTYYWRIDEVNGVDVWKGSIWSFTTANCLIVDDFEQYDDYCDRVFYTWTDGWGHSADPGCGVAAYGGNGTGSTVGATQAPFTEQNIVHGGIQSMPFEYNNTGTGGKARYSETSLEFAVAQNFTSHGIKGLSLWFHGETSNTPDTLYVALEDGAAQVRVATHPDPEALQVAGWQAWYIDMQQFSGVNLASIKKVYLGVGNRTSPQMGGSGKLYIDDIRVCPPQCVPSLGTSAADLSANCIVDYADVEIVADQWLDGGFVIMPTDPGSAGLIAHYPFNSNANDVVGGHNGTTYGIVSYGGGKVGQAIILDGVDDYIDCGADPSLNITGAVTVSAWIRLSAVGIDQKIAGNQDNLTGGYKLGVFTNDLVEFEIRTSANAGTLNRGVTGGTTLAAGTWYHVAGVYSEGNCIRTYVNGLLDRELATTQILGSSTGTLKMGCEPFTTTAALFNGRIDEVRIYNRALSGVEVVWLAGRTSPFSIPADLYQDDVIDFKDLAVLGDSWLEEILWP